MEKKFFVRFERGHIIDDVTQKRIIPKYGKKFWISGDQDAFIEEQEEKMPYEPLSSSKKEEEMIEKYGKGNFIKLLDANTYLRFRVGLANPKKEEDKTKSYHFTCVIKEDLYLFKIKAQDGTKKENWRLADCLCQLEDCMYGDLVLYEKLYAESLSSLFSHVVMFYFSLKRSTGCNVFKEFYAFKEKKTKAPFSINFENEIQLDQLREKVVSEHVNHKKYTIGNTNSFI